MSWSDFMKDTVGRLDVLQQETPETFAGFNQMGRAAKTNGALDEKTKELLWELRSQRGATAASRFTSSRWYALRQRARNCAKPWP